MSSVDLNIETTVMAVRERIMEYFKGTCVNRLTRSGNIRLEESNIIHGYQYLRSQQQREAPSIVYISNVPILTLKREPNVVVFHVKVLSRSKQLREVSTQLNQFFDTYLAGIVKEESNAIIS